MGVHEYLFVTGCARSGTSVMADLLRSHPRIAMGRERYTGRYYSEANLPQSLFEKERFCRQFHEQDSHHPTLQPYYAELYSRFDQCAYRGDKIPGIALNYAPLLDAYIRPKIIFMLRNCVDVADSFNRRAATSREQGNRRGWPWDRGSEAAVEEWNLSLHNTLAALDSIDAFVVIYERLFTDDTMLPRIFDFLSLPITDEVIAVWQICVQRRQILEAKRQLRLSSLDKVHIVRNADTDAYRRALHIAEGDQWRHREAWSTSTSLR